MWNRRRQLLKKWVQFWAEGIQKKCWFGEMLLMRKCTEDSHGVTHFTAATHRNLSLMIQPIISQEWGWQQLQVPKGAEGQQRLPSHLALPLGLKVNVSPGTQWRTAELESMRTSPSGERGPAQSQAGHVAPVGSVLPISRGCRNLDLYMKISNV